MGKKKPQKTKEIAVAIAEASTTGDETQKEEPQIHTPRKRGRPRKIIEKIAGSEDTKEESVGNQSKKARTSEVEDKNQQAEAKGSSPSIRDEEKEKVRSEEKELPRRSSRRKSKPRKSS